MVIKLNKNIMLNPEVMHTFEYYDGPESGILRVENNKYFLFSSIGESRTRIFRAFSMLEISSNWKEQIQSKSSYFPKNEELSKFFEKFYECKYKAYIQELTNGNPNFLVSISCPGMEWMKASKIFYPELYSIIDLKDWTIQYNKVHKLIKNSIKAV